MLHTRIVAPWLVFGTKNNQSKKHSSPTTSGKAESNSGSSNWIRFHQLHCLPTRIHAKLITVSTFILLRNQHPQLPAEFIRRTQPTRRIAQRQRRHLNRLMPASYQQTLPRHWWSGKRCQTLDDHHHRTTSTMCPHVPAIRTHSLSRHFWLSNAKKT